MILCLFLAKTDFILHFRIFARHLMPCMHVHFPSEAVTVDIAYARVCYCYIWQSSIKIINIMTNVFSMHNKQLEGNYMEQYTAAEPSNAFCYRHMVEKKKTLTISKNSYQWWCKWQEFSVMKLLYSSRN